MNDVGGGGGAAAAAAQPKDTWGASPSVCIAMRITVCIVYHSV